MNSSPIIKEQHLPASKEKVWKALSHHQTMLKWYFDVIPAFEARVGFRTQFRIMNEGRSFTHIWEVVEVVEGEKLSCWWSFSEYPGKASVTFEIFDHGDHTDIRVTNTPKDPFPEDIPEFQRKSCEDGWEFFLERLRDFLAGKL